MTFFQDLVVEMVFEGDDYRDGRRRTIKKKTSTKTTTKAKAGLVGDTHWDV